VKQPETAVTYPQGIDTAAERALYDNLGQDAALAMAIDKTVRETKKDGWRGNRIKEKEVRYAIRRHLDDEAQVDAIFDLVVHQDEY